MTSGAETRVEAGGLSLEPSPEQDLLTASVREVLRDRCDPSVVRAAEADAPGVHAALWPLFGDLGWLALPLAQHLGGLGSSALDCALVAEQCGRALVPGPLLETWLAARLLGACADRPPEGVTEALARGAATVVPIWLDADREARPIGLDVDEARLVPNAPLATSFLALRKAGETVEVSLLSAASAEIRPLPTLGSVSAGQVQLGGAAEWSSALPAEVLSLELARAVTAQALFLVGAGSHALEQAADYSKERVQFGRPIGSFQAPAHAMASAATLLAGARVLALRAAWTLDEAHPSAARLCAAAKQRAAEAARTATATSQQVYGGTGFIAEADVQLYYRRVKQEALALGSPTAWRRLLVSESSAAMVVSGL